MADIPQVFARRAQLADCLPDPGPIFPIPFLPEDSEGIHENDPEDTEISSYLSRFLSIFSFSSLHLPSHRVLSLNCHFIFTGFMNTK